MHSRCPHFLPWGHLGARIVKGYCLQGEPNKALEVFLACSSMRRVVHCRVLWRQIMDARGIEPSDIVLGCMFDAFVSNDSLEAAVELMDEWKCRVKPNTEMHSIIIKGFAATRQSFRAMAMWREMLEQKIPIHTVAYNALIDAQARVGAMDEVETLVTSMQPNGCTPDVITFLYNCEWGIA